MEKLVEQKKLDKIILPILVSLYIVLLGIQVFLPTIIPISKFPTEIQSYYIKIQTVVVVGVIIGLLQLLISVQLVNVAQSLGFYISFCINILNILLVLQSFFLKKEFSSLPGIVISVISIVLCLIVFAQQKKIQSHLKTVHHFAYIDDLTGLPNRKERISTISDLIYGPQKVSIFSLMMLDFDNFKLINDTIGHQIGDVLLQEVVHNLKKFIQEPISIGRIGGDEFLIIIPGAISESELESYAVQINKIINMPFYYKEKEYRLTASFGISRYPKDSTNPAELMQQADIALFRAKAQGKNRIEFFDQKMQITLENQVNIEQKLANAINNKEIYLEFQPQFFIPGEKLRGFEVLARWTSPTMGRIAPQDFIPVAEENGLIIQIGKWIIKEACSVFVKIYGSNEEKLMLAINISVVQFRDPDFLKFVRQTIEETGINTEFLEFEITESVYIQSPEITKILIDELKKLGITIALDDFGTGYSSLSYLRSLPLDVVKIDKSFVDTIGTVSDEKNIIKSIIEMSHKLDLKVIAEGIERKDQLEYLEKVNCDIIQGNFLGKPAPIAAL